MPSNGSLRPLYIQVHARDNVAIIANEGGLPSGAQFDSGLTLLEAIPEAHKVALSAIGPGQAIVRYGAVIGYAEVPIAQGSWVHEGVMSLPAAPPLDELPLATAVPAPLPRWMDIPSKAISTTTGPLEQKIFSALPRRYSVFRLR